MYSTQKSITEDKPVVHDGVTAGKYLRYPKSDVERGYESGLRVVQQYKSGSIEKPLISVVTTVINRSLTIEKAIISVLTQTYDNIEYIIVDAGSTDGTLDIIKKYEDVIDYIVSEPDKGIYDGMNKGVELAQGDFIIMLNSDDWYMPNCIQVLVTEAIKKSLDMVCALAVETDKYGNVIRNIPFMPFNDNVRLRMPLRHETMLISSSLYNKVGLYDVSYKIIADLKLTQKIFNSSGNCEQIRLNLMCFRKMGVAQEITNDLLAERGRLIQEQFSFLSKAEIEFLAGNYTKSVSDYVDVATKYIEHVDFVKGVREFLRLHGVFRKKPFPKNLQVFENI